MHINHKGVLHIITLLLILNDISYSRRPISYLDRCNSAEVSELYPSVLKVVLGRRATEHPLLPHNPMSTALKG